MVSKTAIFFFFIVAVACVAAFPGGHGGGGHHKVTIHVPIHEKTIKHTHTKYVTIHHKDEGHEKEHEGHFHSDPFGGDHHHHH